MAQRVTVVDGTTWTGAYADDGSWIVVVSDGIGFCGQLHPCGGRWVTVDDDTNEFFAEDGSINVSELGDSNGGPLSVEVVSGDLDPSPLAGGEWDTNFWWR